jgi:hypothetical protein
MTDSFEKAMVASERAVDAAMRTATATLRELRKARTSAKTGQIRDLRRALAAAESAATAVAEETRLAGIGLDLDDQEYLASGGYAKELLEAASSAGVAMFEEDERLLCYPSLVRILPNDAAVEIDKVRERRLRPSVLVEMLRARQERPPRFKPEVFLDSLRSAYELVAARDGKRPDAVARLVDVWAALTMLPGHGREYGKQEFARDLYLLDQSGITATARSPRQLRWSASTGTKGSGVLTTVARTGQQQRYWGISFTLDSTGAGS